MDCLTKKIIKKTNPNQFRALVDSMDEFPELATLSPSFGKTKAEIEAKWDIVAVRPPIRNGTEWKKIWADIKCRTKGKIAENTKNMNGTSGGPSCVTLLTEIENDIDWICHLSAAAAPTGNTFGVTVRPKMNKPIALEATPPRRTNNVAIVSLTTSGTKSYSPPYYNIPNTVNTYTQHSNNRSSNTKNTNVTHYQLQEILTHKNSNKTKMYRQKHSRSRINKTFEITGGTKRYVSGRDEGSN